MPNNYNNNNNRSWRDEPSKDSQGGRSNSYNDRSSSYGDRNNNRSSYGDRNNSYGGDSWRGNSNRYQNNSVQNQNKEMLKGFTKDFLKEYLINENTVDATEFYKQNEIELKNTTLKPIMKFEDLKLPNGVFKYIKEKKFENPTPIQSQGWPIALKGEDMVGVAQTGSGKSLSFIIPALIHLMENHKNNINSVVLVLAPTRELIKQIAEIVDALSWDFNVKTALLYGGASMINQQRQLRDATFICATPGRLIDLSNQGCVPLNNVSFLVLDEADRMLDMGFEPQLREIVRLVPDDRQTLMWSATWPESVQSLARTYMKEYSQIRIGGNELVTNKRIEQQIIITNYKEKKTQLEDLVKKHSDKKIIIFANKKSDCDGLERDLYYNDDLKGLRMRFSSIHGDKRQASRDKIIADFKNGYCNVLIATDVAARGLDVKDVAVVINYDMPNNCEQYVHRIGRTGRGGSFGVAYTLFTEDDAGLARELSQMLRKTGQTVPDQLESMGQYGKRRQGGGRGGYGGYSRGRDSGQNRRRW